LLEGVVAHFECSTEAQYDGGDHLIILGRVRRFSHFEGGCLLFAQGRYGVVEDHPEMKRAQQATPRQPGDILGDSATLRLLFNALHYTYAEFERSRLADGLTIAQIRALNGLYETPGIGAAELANRMYLGQRDTEDALGDLVDSGDVLQTGDSFELTPSGRERREAIRRRIREFEKAFLADIPESEIAIGRRFLERLIAKHGASNPLSG
jgi:DNA-binding MarR family transcriptional regulator